nr:hypothetical protein [Tanacetum cinerariifolium]
MPCAFYSQQQIQHYKEMELLFCPMYEEYFNAGNQSESKSSALSNNTLNAHPTLEPITPPTNINVEENNNDQAEDAQFEAYEFINPFAPPRTEAAESSSRNFEAYEFINPFAPPRTEAAESSSRNVDTSNMHTLYQRHRSDCH